MKDTVCVRIAHMQQKSCIRTFSIIFLQFVPPIPDDVARNFLLGFAAQQEDQMEEEYKENWGNNIRTRNKQKIFLSCPAYVKNLTMPLPILFIWFS